MLSEDRSVGVVFNGCIYNFLELRAELEQHGRRFRSQCDTEVLVQGYQQWGIEVLAQRLRGMFAFAVWDEPRRTLSLVRDRLGVKPLLFYPHAGKLAFASTMGALSAAGFRGGIDPAAVLQYLDYGNVAGNQCIFHGVKKVVPGTIVQWKDGVYSESVYWTLPVCDESSKVTFNEAVEETERILIESVRLRLISDVPVSALLSGGVDSSLVCWALSRLNANLTAFTVGAGGDPSDETRDASHTARLLGIPHQIVELSVERPELLEEMECAYGEPFACQSAQAMLRVSRAVKPMATVLLTGDGGDDVFLGYPFLHSAWVAQQTARKLPAAAAGMLRAAASCLPRSGLSGRARNLLRYSTSGLSAYIDASNHMRFYEQHDILGDKLQGLRSPYRSLPPSFDSARRLLSDVLEQQHQVHFLGQFMEKVDGATMYYSIEARSPFLDQKLWEFAASLPPALHFHGGRLKSVLREIVSRRVNPELARRPKQGFTVPVESWLADRWTRSLDVLTGPNELERQGWIRRGSLAAPIAEARRAKWVPVQLWYLLLLEHWLRRQNA